jgi:hypothetical protein
MSKKKAYLVTFSVTTRITAVPDEDGELKAEDLEQARLNCMENLKNEGLNTHLADYEEDQQCPYDETDDDNSDL